VEIIHLRSNVLNYYRRLHSLTDGHWSGDEHLKQTTYAVYL